MKTNKLFSAVFICIALLLGFNLNTNAQTQIDGDIDGEAAGDLSGSSLSMSDANTVAIGAYRNDGNGIDAGNVRIYAWNGSSWVQKGVDINGEAADDNSGVSVSMPDNITVAIGAHFNSGSGSNAGHVRIYTWNGSTWIQKGADIDGEAADDVSGAAVCMGDANSVAIGAPYNDGNGLRAGHVRIYAWNGSAWIQKGLDIDGETAGDYSGSSVSLPDNNTVAIGAWRNTANGTNAGHVRIYIWNGSGWMQQGVDIDGEAAEDHSGWSVSMPDAGIVSIGAQQNDGNGTEAGHVRIYCTNALTCAIMNNIGDLHNSFGNILKTYPNPTQNNIVLDLRSVYYGIVVIVRNGLAQEVNRQAFGSSSKLQLTLPEEAGIYCIEVIADNDRALLKVIKE